MFRDRRQERREERRGGGGATHYRMRQKLVSIGDDYWIEDDQGERVFKVDGKALRVRETLIFEGSDGSELLKIQQRIARVRDTMEIEDRDGHTVATVRKALHAECMLVVVPSANARAIDVAGSSNRWSEGTGRLVSKSLC